jgi:hypothetical protein
MIAEAPSLASPATGEASTEDLSEKAAGTELAAVPTTLAESSTAYRPGFPLIRLAEISLGLAALIMGGLTLWVRRRG